MEPVEPRPLPVATRLPTGTAARLGLRRSATTAAPAPVAPAAELPVTAAPAGWATTAAPVAELPVPPPFTPAFAPPGFTGQPPAGRVYGPPPGQGRPGGFAPPGPPGPPRPSPWPGPRDPAGPRVLAACGAAGVSAAIALPLDRPAVGWLVVAVVAALGVHLVARHAPARAAWPWAAAAMALFGVGTVRAAEWLFALCVLAACAAASLAMARGRSVRGLLFGSLAVPLAALRTLPWLVRGATRLRGGAGSRPVGLLLSVAAGALLIAVFAPLLAGADAAFSRLLSSALPAVDVDAVARWPFLVALLGLGTAGACFLLFAPVSVEPADDAPRSRVRLVEWVLPVGALVVLFAVFVTVQVVTVAGGSAPVLETAGLTYAEYARRGFWQLSAVTLLVLPVLGIAGRWAPRATAGQRWWLRGLLGALAVLTLAMVVSALIRLGLYQQAYGWTVLRLLVGACELWLGVVYVMVLLAGARLRTGWVPRAAVIAGVAALIGLAVLNPDRFVAERNVDRYENAGEVDLRYLSDLSADAAPAIARLPEPLRSCALDRLVAGLDDDGHWREWNLGRSAARDLAGRLEPASDERCSDLLYAGDRTY